MAIITKIFNNWPLPAERNFGWKMKSLTSAKTSFSITKAGVFDLRIAHERLHGISPKMLLWWFQNIGGHMTYQGKTYPRYLVWHPIDHIHWELAPQSIGKPVGVGSYFRIVEAFGRNRDFLIDSVECVEKLDETGIRLVRKIGSIEVFSLEHHFRQDGNDTLYTSQMLVGTNHPLGLLFNYLFRPFIFTKKMGEAWLKHNIEEVGNFEYFLPELYQAENGPPVGSVSQ